MLPFTFIFIGRSGCGKGTQAELLMKYLKEKDANTPLYYLETGQKFREFIAGDGFTSSLSKQVMDEGGLQPEFVSIHIWSHLFIENLKGEEHIVIDGTPRKLREAYVLDGAMDFYKRETIYIVYMNVGREWSMERLKGRGRADDIDLESINKRLDWFETDVLPVIEFYKNNQKYKFLDINGERSIEEIHADIVSKVFHN